MKKEEGIFSIVQSPEESEHKTIGKNKIRAKKQAKILKDKGVISVIQTPEEDKKNIIKGN
jgi:hypothetical protein